MKTHWMNNLSFDHFTILIVLSILFFHQFGFAETLNIKVYDSALGKTLDFKVDSVTGQYKVDLTQFFDPQYETKKLPNVCEFYEDYLNSHQSSHPDVFSGDHLPIHIRLFHNYRDLTRLHKQIKRILVQKGHVIEKLENITDFYVDKVNVEEISWENNAMSFQRQDFIEKADANIKQLFEKLEKSPYLVSQNGSFDGELNFYPLHCDLTKKLARFKLSVTITQIDFYNDNVLPVKSFLVSDELVDLSEKLKSKDNFIRKIRPDKNGILNLSQAKFIYSAGLLGQILNKQGITLEEMQENEFSDLSLGLIDVKSGLPRTLNSQTAKSLQEKLYRSNVNPSHNIQKSMTGTLK